MARRMSASYPSRRPNRTSKEIFRLAPLGDSAITVEFGDEIDPRINARAVAFAKAVVDQGWNGILDVAPTYRSVTIHFDALHWKSAVLADRLKTLPRPVSTDTESQGTLHEIPLLYGGEGGPDLDDVATFARLPPAQAVMLHVSIRYRVYMLGFSPGFPYLGLVPERLAMPRMSTPRAKVPVGSVGIAEQEVCRQLREILNGYVTSMDDRRVLLQADSLCLQADTPRAIEFVRLTRSEIASAGVRIKAQS